ncbi:hypothetical protein [Algiphilus sp.]
MRKCYAFSNATAECTALVWRARRASLCLMLAAATWLSVSGSALADAPPAHPTAPALSLFAHPAAAPLDPDGDLDRDALLERVQLIVWDRQRIAKPAPEGALGAASAELLFGIISGGSGAGQDLANPKE